MQIEGSAEIRIVDSRTNQIKQVVKQKNIITDQCLLELLSFGVAAVGTGRRISISTQTTTPDKKKNLLTGIIATGYIPAGVTSPTLFIDYEPPFGQIQNRIDYINVERTFNSVGLTDRGSNNNEANVTHSAIAYLLLDTPCTQGVFDFIDIFYRIQFLNTNGQGILVPGARLDFCRSFFGFGFYERFYSDGYYRSIPPFCFLNFWASPCNLPTDLYMHLGNGRENTQPSKTQIPKYFKYAFKFTRALEDSVGQIYNTMLQGSSLNLIPYTISSFLKKPRTPFQNLFTHSSAATKPFFDSLNLASGSGKVRLDGVWEGKWPEMYKISIVDSGATGVATYKWSVRKHIGFEGNTYTDILGIDNIFTTHRLIPAPGRHGWKKEDFDVHRYSNTQICQYDETGVSLVDIWNGDYKNWDSTTTPALPVTMVRQCAVDETNKKIYVGCRQTGLWVIDPETNTVTHPVLDKCYGVDVGLNNIAIGVFEGRISTSSNWDSPISFSYIGISDNNWNRVYYLKADPQHPEGRFAIVCSVVGNTNRQLVWWRLNSPVAIRQATFTYASPGDTNGLLYYLGTSYGEQVWVNPHNTQYITCIMSSVEVGSPAAAVNRDVTPTNVHTNNVANSWYTIDLGSENKVRLNKVLLRGYAPNDNYAIRNFKVQGSNNVANNTVAGVNAATWDDLAVFVNDTRMPQLANAWANYDIPSFATVYRHIRILQNGVNSNNTNHLMINELEFYGEFSHISNGIGVPKSGIQSAGLKPWCASLEVSDIGGFWYAHYIGRLIHNNILTVDVPNLSWPIHPFNHTIWGSNAYYKVSFYKEFIISNSNIIDSQGVIKNNYITISNHAGNLSLVIHMTGGMVLVSGSSQAGLYMRQLFTDNSFCWDNYGWENNQWVLNATGAKTTHAIAESLGNGVTARFENGNIEPHFFATDFHTQAILNGFLKDNVSTLFYESAWYSKPAEFNYPVQSGAVIPSTKTKAATTAQYWRLINIESPTGHDKGMYFWELIFKDSSGTDITTGGTVSASYPANGSYPFSNIFDKNTNSFGGGPNTPPGSWIEYKFATPVTPTSLTIRGYNDTSHNIPTTKYAIATSTDGKTWGLLQYFTLPIVATNTPQNVALDPSLHFEGFHQVILSAVNNPRFLKLEIDSPKLINLKINDQPVVTTYVGEFLPAIPPGLNEVFVSSAGTAIFNPADVGKTFTGTYAVIND